MTGDIVLVKDVAKLPEAITCFRLPQLVHQSKLILMSRFECLIKRLKAHTEACSAALEIADSLEDLQVYQYFVLTYILNRSRE